MPEPSGGDMTAAFATALESAPSTPAVETPPVSTPQTTEPTPASTPAAATVQPGETQAPAVEPSTDAKADGEPPAWRWQDILKHARETSAKEAETRVRQEVEQQYSGLKDFSGMDATERAGLLVMHRAMAGDPQARAHVAQVQPQLAQSLGWTQAPQADPMPEPDLQAQDGTLVYSSKQEALKDEWLERQLTSKIMKRFEARLKPIEDERAHLEAAKERATYQSASQSAIEAIKGRDPEFNVKVHGPQVWAVIQGNPKLTELALNAETAAIAIDYAWSEVHRTHVLPAKQQQAKADVLTTLQQQAVAATVNPNAATSTTPKKFKPGQQGFAEALAHFGS